MALSEKIPTHQGIARGGSRWQAVTCTHAHGLALLAALAWGLGNVSQKTILDHLDPYTANGVTCLVGALVLSPFALHETAQNRGHRTGGLRLLGLIAVTFTLAATLMQVGYGHTTVTNAGFLVNTAAVLTPMMGWIWYRQRPVFWVWPSSLCTVFGVFLMGGGGISSFSFGDVLSLLSALAFGVWTLLVGAYVLRHGRPLLLTLVQLAGCGVICVGLGVGQNGLPTQSMLANALPEIVMIGFVSKGFAYALMATAQQHISPNSAAVLVSAESIFGAALAMTILGETPGVIRIIGGMCIILGVVMAMRIPVLGVEPVEKS